MVRRQISGSLALTSLLLLTSCEGFLEISSSDNGQTQVITIASGTPGPEASGNIIQIVAPDPSPSPGESTTENTQQSTIEGGAFFDFLNSFTSARPGPLPSTLADITSDEITPYWSESSSVVIEDFNRDGRPDFFTTQMGYEAKLHLSQPDGSFRSDIKSLFPVESGNWSMSKSAIAVDLDEDGRKDLLVSITPATASSSPLPLTAHQPGLYLTAGGRLGVAADPGLALQGWSGARSTDLNRLFGRLLNAAGPDGNDMAIGSGLAQAAKLAAADMDGDGFEEIFVQANDGPPRVLISPSLEGTVTRQSDGQLLFKPDLQKFPFTNSKNFTFAALWNRADTRTLTPNSRLLIWPVSSAQQGRAPLYVRSEAREATVSALFQSSGQTQGFFLNSDNFPENLIGTPIRVRQQGTWVARKFQNSDQVRARSPVVHVADLNNDGRMEVIVADGTLHAEALAAKCSTAPTLTEACREGRLHIYGLNPTSKFFVDSLRQDSSQTPEAFQKGFPTVGAIATVDLDGNGVKDLLLLPRTRSEAERIALTLDARNIPDEAPLDAVNPFDAELHSKYLAGKTDGIPEDSYFAQDQHGLANSRPKILLLQSDPNTSALTASRVSPQNDIAAKLPAFLNQDLDVQSATQIRDGVNDWLLISTGFSVPSNSRTIIAFKLKSPTSTTRALEEAVDCPTRQGDEIPQTSLFPGIAAADFDGDGRMDVLNLPVGQGVIHFGSGDGCFQHRNRLPLDSRFVNQLQAVDMNADGALDLVGALDADTPLDMINPNARALLYINDGTGRMVDHSRDLQVDGRNFTANRVVAADLNGDQRPDLVLFGSNKLRKHSQLSSQGVVLLLNRGLAQTSDGQIRMQFEKANSCLPPYLRDWSVNPDTEAQSPAFSPLAVDLDTDRRIDIVLGRRKGNPDILFNGMVRESNEEVCARSDCSAEAIRAGRCARLISARFDLGAETQQSGPLLSISPQSTGNAQRLSEVTSADFNSDGKPDLIFSSAQGAVPNTTVSQFNLVFINRIQGSFMNEFPTGDWRLWFTPAPEALPQAASTLEGAVCAVATDLDEDQRPDLFLAAPAECHSNTQSPLENPHCHQKTENLTPPWADLSVWDFRARGLVLANVTTEEGGTRFSSEGASGGNTTLTGELTRFPGTQTFNCSSADFNGDGCNDIYVSGYGFGNVENQSYGGTSSTSYVQKWYSQAKMNRIYLNKCTHTRGQIDFDIIEAERNPFKAYASVSGDFDGDGRAEVIQGGANQMHYFKMK